MVESRDLDLPPTPAAVETPFWTRPFKRHTFVINPDQVAVLVKEETIYSEVPQAGPPPEIHLGRLVYAFDGLDYEFQEFPPSIKAEKGHVVHKTRVALAPGMTPNQRLQLVEATAGAKEQVEYAKHWLAGNPGDDLFLYWLTTKLSPDEMIALVTPRLAARPPLVNWHRVYQTMMEQAHPKEDLRPRYRELVAEQKGNPDAFYLLARLEDLDEGEKLLQQAAAADPPSAHAVRSLGYRALAAGQFDEAVRLLERAVRLAPGNDFTQQEYRSALLAAGRYDRLLEELAARGQGAPSLTVAIERIRTLAAKGDRKGARAAIDQTVTSFTAGNPAGQEMVRASLEAFLSCALGDVPGFLKAAGNVPGLPAFEPALLEGKLDEAAGKIEDPRAPAAGIDHGLLYLAARKANNGPLAETQWQAVLAALQGGDREAKEIGDVFAGRRPLDVDRLRRLPVDVQLKRVWLAIAAQRFPQRAKELVTLARKLDFQRDPTSLCLRRVLP